MPGEGSRGGKVIGHTASGKPIYSSGGIKTGHEGWSHTDHHEASQALRRHASSLQHGTPEHADAMSQASAHYHRKEKLKGAKTPNSSGGTPPPQSTPRRSTSSSPGLAH